MLEPEEYDRLNKAMNLAPGTLEQNRYYVRDQSLVRLLDILDRPSESRNVRLAMLFCAASIPLLVIISPTKELPEFDYFALSISVACLGMDKASEVLKQHLKDAKQKEIEKIRNMIPLQNRTPRL